MAESMLESDAARIAAMTRPIAPLGNALDMKYGSIRSDARADGAGLCWKYANSASPTNESPIIHNASPAALTMNARRASLTLLVVCRRWTIT